MSRRSLLTAAAALSISFGGSAVAHAQGTITLPTTCVPIPDQGVVNTGGASVAGTGLIQNLGQGLLIVNCDIARAELGRSANGTITIDALSQGVDPLSGRRILTARMMAAASRPIGGLGATTFMFVNFSTSARVRGWQRITSAQFPLPIDDSFGVFLRVTLNRGDVLGRILFREI
jgi:hypothetical protein